MPVVEIPSQVDMPCFASGNGLSLVWELYATKAVICHIGVTLHSGHCQTFLRGDLAESALGVQRRYLPQDDVPAVESSTLEIQSDEYVLLLQIPQTALPDTSAQL